MLLFYFSKMFWSASLSILVLSLVMVNSQPTTEKTYSDTCQNVEWKIEKILNAVTEKDILNKEAGQKQTTCLTGISIHNNVIVHVHLMPI